jgi:hypothetical protein
VTLERNIIIPETNTQKHNTGVTWTCWLWPGNVGIKVGYMHAKVYSVSMILGRYNHKYYVEISDWRRSVSRCGGVHFFFFVYRYNSFLCETDILCKQYNEHFFDYSAHKNITLLKKISVFLMTYGVLFWIWKRPGASLGERESLMYNTTWKCFFFNLKCTS